MADRAIAWPGAACNPVPVEQAGWSLNGTDPGRTRARPCHHRGMDAFTLDPIRVRGLSDRLLDDRGRLRVVPARELATTLPEERLLFGVRHGLYGFSTLELVDFLRTRIAVRSAIEIGAGHGVLAQALGIPATDNRQQEDEYIQTYYRALGQPTVPYGDHVEKLEAAAALAKYRPQVVIACWVTHRLEAERSETDSGATVVDEAAIVAACEHYIVIGNERVLAHKLI
jgi:hypothetical protein